MLLIRSLLCANPGARVVYDIKSSSVVAEEVAAAGGVALPERSGHAFIKRRLFEEGALLGGEVSGHYFIGKLERDDALYTAVLLLQVLDELGMSLGQAAATVASYPITPDLRIPCAPQEAQAIITELRGNLADWPQEHLDGVRILFEDGWALARTSVTEPLITLRFEAHSVAALARIQQLTRQASPRLAAIWQPEPGKLSN